MARIATPIILMVVGSSFLSATAAAVLGVQDWRMAALLVLVLVLVLLALLVEPEVAVPHDGTGLWLLLLLALILALDVRGGIDPVEYKIVLPILLLLAGPRIARLLRPGGPALPVLGLLTAYVAVTGTALLLVDPSSLRRGSDALVRWDVTGSVVTHASLCAVQLAVALSLAGRRDLSWTGRAALLMAPVALVMLLLTGTRTVVIMLALFAALMVASSPERGRALPAALLAGLGLLLAFGLYSLLVSDAFLLRLAGGGEDYSSGRAVSVLHWLSLATEQPMGMGLGAVRAMLAEDRPALDGEQLLEWPHNELVRFWVEAGPFGLLLVLGLIATLVRRAWRVAGAGVDPVSRALALALAADLVVESLLQNFWNGIYQATAFTLVLVTLPLAAAEPAPAGLTSVGGQR